MLGFEQHPSDDAIELYALGRLPAESVIPLEGHLLVCEQCQDALQKEDAFAQALLGALKPPAQPE
jgi:hypothetical protein